MFSKKDLILIMIPFLLLLILNAFCQQSFSTTQSCEYQYQTFRGIEHRNVSVTFHVGQSLPETQYLRWTKNWNTLIGIYHSYSHDFVRYVSNKRYTLVEGFEDNTFELSITFARENDSGTHNIQISDGIRSICWVLRLDLRIDNTDPTCNALLYRTMEKVGMFCRWIQVDKGDYAEIVARESVVVSKGETGINDWRYVYWKIINTFSVYVTVENLIAGNDFPLKCLVFHKQKNVNKTCAFPSVMQQPIWNEQIEQFMLERCIQSEHNIPPTWWYSVEEKLIPLEFTTNYTLSNIHHIVFFYGEEDDHSNVILHSMNKFNYWDNRFSNVSFLAESTNIQQQQTHSPESLECNNLTVTVIVTDITMISTSTSNSPSAPFTKLSTTEGICSRKYIVDGITNFWSSMTGVASALGFIFGIIFTTLYGKCREKYTTLGVRRSSTTAVGNENAESLEITTFFTRTSQPGEASLPHHTVSNQPLVDTPLDDSQLGFLHSGRRNPSSLSASRALVERELNSNLRHATTCGVHFASSELLDRSGRIHKNSECTHDHEGNSKKHNPNAVVVSGPSFEITYCSLDDIDGATSNTENTDLLSSPTSMKSRALRFDGNKDCKSSYSIREETPSSVKTTDSQEDVLRKPIVDVESHYAKPDMSRKSRKIHRSAASRGVTKHHDQEDRAPTNDDWRNVRIAMNQTNRVAENDVGSDVLVDGPIYGNSLSIRNLNDEPPREDALYVNSYSSQDS